MTNDFEKYEQAIEHAFLHPDVRLLSCAAVHLVRDVERITKETGHPPDRAWLEQQLKDAGIELL